MNARAKILAALSCVLVFGCGAEPAKAPPVEPGKPAQPALPAAPPAPPEPKVEEIAAPPKRAPVVASPIDASWKTHRDAKLGVEFRYPSDYVLRSKRLPGGITSILLLEDDEFARGWLAGTLKEATDGPMQIAFQLRNVAISDTFEAFVRAEVERNGGSGELESITVAGAPALAYAADGLWAGHTVSILAARDHLLLASGKRRMFIVDAHVDYNSPEDRIRKDFEAMLSTLKLPKTE